MQTVSAAGKTAPRSEQDMSIGSEMRVGISSFGSWMLGVGSIIGSMAWLFHGPMLARGGSLACLCAWGLAGVMMVPLVLILMELSSMFPTAGGPYVFKYYAFKRLMPGMGEMVGFLTGWLFWICLIAGLACMSNGLANLLATCFYGSPGAAPIWFGPSVIFALFGAATALNLMQVQSAARLNNVFTLLKLGMALSFGALVFFSPHSSLDNIWKISASGPLPANIASVIMLALAGFGGIEIATCASSETVNARRTIPRSVFMTLVTVALIYGGMCLAVSVASPYVLSADKSTMVVAGTHIQATCPSIAGYLGGPVWGLAFTACVVASIVGCGFSCLLGNARVAYSMARTGLFPSQFARLDKLSGVPRYALWFQFWCLCIIGVGANVMAYSRIFPDAYTFLAEVFGFMYAFVALLYAICAVSLRYTDPDMPRPHRIGRQGNALMWLLSGLTACIWGFAAFGCVHWSHQLAGIAILLAGVPIYAYYRRRRAEPVPIPEEAGRGNSSH